MKLFSDEVQEDPEAVPRRLLRRDLTIPVEQVVILGVVLISSLVAAFAFGVARGRRGAVTCPAVRAVKARPPAAPSRPEAAVALTEAPTASSTMTGQRIPASPEKKVDKFYTVQVASFKLEESARKEAEGLKGMGHKIFVLPKGRHSIVCIGKFKDKTAARALSHKLRKRYKDCLIRSL